MQLTIYYFKLFSQGRGTIDYYMSVVPILDMKRHTRRVCHLFIPRYTFSQENALKYSQCRTLH